VPGGHEDRQQAMAQEAKLNRTLKINPAAQRQPTFWNLDDIQFIATKRSMRVFFRASASVTLELIPTFC
jgi:hypothetical protein